VNEYRAIEPSWSSAFRVCIRIRERARFLPRFAIFQRFAGRKIFLRVFRRAAFIWRRTRFDTTFGCGRTVLLRDREGRNPVT
jgi:hypothetical protein